MKLEEEEKNADPRTMIPNLTLNKEEESPGIFYDSDEIANLTGLQKLGKALFLAELLMSRLVCNPVPWARNKSSIITDEGVTESSEMGLTDPAAIQTTIYFAKFIPV